MISRKSSSSLLSQFVIAPATASGDRAGIEIRQMLRAVRDHLGMEVSFISEFSEGRRFFRHVDSACSGRTLAEGASDLLEDSYCQRVVDGRLPEIIEDAATLPAAAELSITLELSIGAYLSVPIHLSNGQLYGTFCCFKTAPDHTLTQRDLGVMRVFAQVAAQQIEQDLIPQKNRQAIEERIIAALNGEIHATVYQPIHHIGRNKVVGFEALSRFASSPLRSPDLWFADAASVGQGFALEITAIRNALQGLEHLGPEVYLSVNASPETLANPRFHEAFLGFPLDQIVLELTEHALVERYEDIVEALRPLREKGLRIAVDDAGAGYASFRHILNLAPEKIKLDMSLTRNIDTDRSRQALAAALVGFTEKIGSEMIAEGVETPGELQTLQELGIKYAQGYLLGKPLPLPDNLALNCLP